MSALVSVSPIQGMAKGSHPVQQTKGDIIAKLILCIGLPFALFIITIIKIILDILT